MSNFRPDDIIKSLVYKVVPALYQSEQQRAEVFNREHGLQQVDGDDQNDKSTNQHHQRRQHYFSPDEPIR